MPQSLSQSLGAGGSEGLWGQRMGRAFRGQGHWPWGPIWTGCPEDAAGARRASSRNTIWEGLGAKVLTLEFSSHPRTLEIRPESATSHLLVAQCWSPTTQQLGPSPFCLRIHALALASGPGLFPGPADSFLFPASPFPGSQFSLPSLPSVMPLPAPLCPPPPSHPAPQPWDTEALEV